MAVGWKRTRTVHPEKQLTLAYEKEGVSAPPFFLSLNCIDKVIVWDETDLLLLSCLLQL
jgi:hypothetical protein